MWVLTKEEGGVLWVEISTEEVDHFILPIFTSPDTAMDFVVDLTHDDEKVILHCIKTVDQMSKIISILKEQQASAVILDPPNPETMTANEELVYWTGAEFCDIIAPIVSMAATYGEKRAVEVLNRYLKDKLGNPIT